MARATRLSMKRIFRALLPLSGDGSGGADGTDDVDGETAAGGDGGEVQEARKRFRFDLSCDVICEAKGRRIRGQLRDISTSGALVERAGPLLAGTRVALLIGLTEELQDFALPGEVSRPTRDGFAIRFVDLSREQYLSLCEAISIASDLVEKSSEES
jgi:hypothetical protein